MIGEALGAVGNALSAPRRGLMQLLGLPESGSELVSGLTGLDQDSLLTKALGFGAEVATDPLTYLGGWGARMARGLLPGEAGAWALGKAAGSGEGLANQAFRSQLQNVKSFRNGAMMETGIPGEIGRVEGRALAISNPQTSGKSLVAEVARGRHRPDEELQQAVESMARSADQGANNFYKPLPESSLIRDLHATAPDVPREAIDQAILDQTGQPVQSFHRRSGRHEAIHAIMDQARKQGTQDELPLLLRGPASLPSFLDANAAGPLRALSLAGEEVAAHALQYRTPLRQLGGAADFLFSPTVNAAYLPQVKSLSPAVGAAYGALPGSVVAGGALAPGLSSHILKLLGGAPNALDPGGPLPG